MRKTWIAIFFIVAIGCVQSPTGQVTGENVRVGVSTVLSGPQAYMGEYIKRGALVAQERFNREYSEKLTLTFADDKCRPRTTVSALQKLANADGIRAIAGPSCTASVVPGFAASNDVFVLSSYVNFGNLTNRFMTIRPHARTEGAVMGRFARENLSLRRVGIIRYKGAWGTVLKQGFADAFERGSHDVVGSHAFLSDRDFRTFLLKLQRRDVDGVYFVGTYVNSLAQQIRELGMNVTVVSQFGVENAKSREALQNSSIPLYYTYPRLDREHPFFTAYRKRYGESAGAVSAFSYDTTRFLAEADRACETVSCVEEYVVNTTFSGATGVTDVNASTYTGLQDMIIKTFEDGDFVRYS